MLQTLMDEAPEKRHGVVRLSLKRELHGGKGESPKGPLPLGFATFEETRFTTRKTRKAFIRLSALRLKIATLLGESKANSNTNSNPKTNQNQNGLMTETEPAGRGLTFVTFEFRVH